MPTVWRAVIAAGIAALLTYAAFRFLLGPYVCQSGWASPSVGTQGACSHHGGIDRSPHYWSMLAGVVAAALSFKIVFWIYGPDE